MRRLTALALTIAFSPCTVSAAEPEVLVKQDDGKLHGSLRQSQDGSKLLLRVDGQDVPIGECRDEAVGEPLSLANNRVAVAYVRDCGATVDYATHIALRDSGADRIVAVFGGKPAVRLETKPGGLVVRHSPLPSELVFRRAERLGDVTVSFEPAEPATDPTPEDRLELSSMNYGATGRAAGIPKEVLLRLAGWAQERSGLYRSEWGHWSGSSPYGIAPQTLERIEAGFRYYETEHRNKDAPSH